MRKHLLLFLLLCASVAQAQTIADKLTTINSIKLDIKAALASKSQTVGDDFSVYDDAVASIVMDAQPEVLPLGIKEITATSSNKTWTTTYANTSTIESDATIGYCGNGLGFFVAFLPPNPAKIYKTVDYGTSWSVATQTTTLYVGTGVEYCGSDTVLIGGYGLGDIACLYRSTDRGVTWELKLPVATETTLYYPTYLGSSTVLIGSSNSGKVFRSEDRGANWYERLDTPLTYIRNISCYAEGKALIVASDLITANIIRTEDFGESFSTIATLTASVSSALAYCGDGIFLMGTTSDGVIYRSVDYGENWSIATNTAETFIPCIEYCENGVVYAGTSPNGQILKSVDKGATWPRIEKDTGKPKIYEIAYFGASNILAITGHQSGGSTGNYGSVLKKYGEYLDSEKWR